MFVWWMAIVLYAHRVKVLAICKLAVWCILPITRYSGICDHVLGEDCFMIYLNRLTETVFFLPTIEETSQVTLLCSKIVKIQHRSQSMLLLTLIVYMWWNILHFCICNFNQEKYFYNLVNKVLSASSS